MIRKGLVHVHSDYSYDAKLTLPEYIKYARGNNISFILFAEHCDTFTKQSYEEYKERCRELSDDALLLIPGIEYSAGKGLHIAGFGLEKYAPADTIPDIIETIRKVGGMSSYVHPVFQGFKYIHDLQTVDAIEIHNSKYDGILSARYKSYRLLKKYLEVNPGMAVTCGTDYHKTQDFKNYVYLYIDGNKLEKNELLKKIKEQDCSFGNSIIKYNINKVGSFHLLLMLLSEYALIPWRNFSKLAKHSFKRRMRNILNKENSGI